MPSTPIARLGRSLAGSRVPLSASHRVQYAVTRPFSSTVSRPVDTNPDPKREAVKDREKMDTSADEYAQSSSDAAAAANESAAFSPNISDPQEAKKEAGKGNEVNPLDASPANPNLGQPTSEVEGGSKKKISEGGGGRQAQDEGKGNESI